jgi:hypothetical protein
MPHTTSTTHRPACQSSRRPRRGDGATATGVERRGASSPGERGGAPQRRPSETSGTHADAMRRALAPRPASSEELATLWAMTKGQRVQAMWHGELSLAQLCKWSSRHPDEVPLIAGEFAWIVIRTPAWAEADRRAPTTQGMEGTT